jgi:hypothetical protein
MSGSIGCNSNGPISGRILLSIIRVREIIDGTIAQIHVWASQILLYWTSSSVCVSRISDQNRMPSDSIEATWSHL